MLRSLLPQSSLYWRPLSRLPSFDQRILAAMNVSERRATAALGSIFALRMLGLFMIVPVFAVYGQQYQGATPALLGLAIGIYGLSQALMQIPMSLLADRYNRKRLIALGLLVFGAGGAVAALSTSIWGVIAGRALAGAGAISAVAMALLADVTREEQRTKAMAAMGMSIALSFIVAFASGPILTHWVGLSGLFWITTGAALLAIGLLAVVPTPERVLSHQLIPYAQQLKTVLKLGDLNRLHGSIFMLHLVMTASFVLIPHLLLVQGWPVEQQGWVYLPLLLLGFIAAIPAIVLSETRKMMRQFFWVAIGLIGVAMGVLAALYDQRWGLLLGVGLFFIGFNLLEALLPSWLAKKSPVSSKATAMGINSSSQFLGAFCGGVLGGQLLGLGHEAWSWAVLLGLVLVWALLVRAIQQPPYLSSLVVALPEHAVLQDWASAFYQVDAIEDVVVLPAENVAYLKVDKQRLDEAARQKLSQILGYPVAI